MKIPYPFNATGQEELYKLAVRQYLRGLASDIGALDESNAGSTNAIQVMLLLLRDMREYGVAARAR